MKNGIAIAGAALTALAAGLAAWQMPSTAVADGSRNGTDYKVDPDWPRELPNNWLVGQVAGVAVDRYDNIWIIQRPRTLTEDERGSDPDTTTNPPGVRRSDCCNLAPAVMVFNRDGDLLRGWGGPADPGYLTSRCTPAMGCNWPENEHGIYVDHNDFVYIAGNGGPTTRC